MPDWTRIVDDRLAHDQLAPDVRREAVAEIAAHLEEHYDALVTAGCADSEGQTLAQVPDWRAFSRTIRKSKEERMKFARKILMPGVAAVLLAVAAMKVGVALLVSPEPCGVGSLGETVIVSNCIKVTADGPVYLPWLAALALTAGFAAWLARRMGARPMQRLAAAMAPAIYMAVEIVVATLSAGFFWRIPIYWILIPALVCGIGAAPFLGDRRGPAEARPATVT